MIAEPTTTEQIYQRADASIAELEQKSTEIASRISQAQDEMTILTQGREERFQGLQQARAFTAQCESQHVQAVQYLKLVAGSPREEQALAGRADSKKRLAEQKQELAKQEQEVAEADQLDKPREQELTTTLQELATEQECIRQEIQGLEQAKEQAFREEGYERYTEAMQTCQATQAKVDELEQQLLTAKIEAFEAHTQALESLKNWPVWKRSIARLRLPDDATIRVLRMNINYYQLLEQDAEKIETPFLPALNNGFHQTSFCDHMLLGDSIARITQARETLARSYYPTGQGDLVSRINGAKATLRSQRQHLEKLLAEYIAYKQR